MNFYGNAQTKRPTSLASYWSNRVGISAGRAVLKSKCQVIDFTTY